jgi:hypothetical protein
MKELRTRMTVRKRFAGLALLAVVGALFVGPATALGQDALSNPSAAQYEPQSQVQGQTTTGSNDAVAATPSSGSNGGGSTGSLPFTGLDVMVLAAVALALIGTGVALRRLSAPKSPSI